MGIACPVVKPESLCGTQVHGLCITRQKRATVLQSSHPLSLPTLVNMHMCCFKGPLYPLFESDATVIHGILCTGDATEIQKLPSPLGINRYPGYPGRSPTG